MKYALCIKYIVLQRWAVNYPFSTGTPPTVCQSQCVWTCYGAKTDRECCKGSPYKGRLQHCWTGSRVHTEGDLKSYSTLSLPKLCMDAGCTLLPSRAWAEIGCQPPACFGFPSSGHCQASCQVSLFWLAIYCNFPCMNEFCLCQVLWLNCPHSFWLVSCS